MKFCKLGDYYVNPEKVSYIAPSGSNSSIHLTGRAYFTCLNISAAQAAEILSKED